MKTQSSGFTIVELLIVIIVIGILSLIAVSAVRSSQDRARDARIAADLKTLRQAITAARAGAGEKVLRDITGSDGTGKTCANKTAGTNFATLNKTSDSCWYDYYTALNAISQASGVRLGELVDPWGRPYYIDENESPTGPCGAYDRISVWTQPFAGGWTTIGKYDTDLPYSRSNC